MKLRDRSLLLGASAALFLLLGLGGVALFTWEARPVFRLRDGSTVRVEEIRYGKPGPFWFGPVWKQRLAPLAPHLPPNVASLVAMQGYDPGARQTRGGLVVALNYSGTVGGRYPFCTLLDGDGCRFRSVDNSPFETDEGEGNVLFFPFFPRREPTFQLEAIVFRPGQPDFVRSLTTPNPVQTHYPAWKAGPLPATQTSGPLAVTLSDVSTGWSRTHLHRPAFGEEVHATRLAYHSAPTSVEWKPVGVGLADAMGGSYRFGTGAWVKEPGALYVPGDNLCRQESAYRYELEFSRASTPAAKPDRLYKFRAVQVPTPDARSPFTFLTLPDGRRFTLAAFESEHGQALQGSWQPREGEIGRIWAYDHGGRLLAAGTPSLPGGKPRSQMLDITVPKGTRRIELRLGLYTSRTVTFTVKPRWITK